MKRITAVLQELKAKSLDGYFTSSVSNITYLTGFTGDSSRLFISTGRCVLMTDGRYTEQARMECNQDIEIFKWLNDKRYAVDTYDYIMNIPEVQRICFEGAQLSYAEFAILKESLPEKDIISEDGLVEKFRQCKDMIEIENLRTACAISDKALELTLPYIKSGISELELTAQLEYNLKRSGAENLSFDTLIISGTRTSLLHGKPGNKKLAEGDFVLFDYGALYKGYHADISRTFVIGKASEKQKEIYSIIKKAQEQAVLFLKPDISANEPDQIVRKIIPSDYIKYYYPGLGHGVGLQIHEMPFLGQAYDGILKRGMTITIEPGIYIPGWGGIRIEDAVVIEESNAVCLSQFPRELMEL